MWRKGCHEHRAATCRIEEISKCLNAKDLFLADAISAGINRRENKSSQLYVHDALLGQFYSFYTLQNFVDQFIMCKDCRYKVWASGGLYLFYIHIYLQVYISICILAQFLRTFTTLRHNQQTFHKLCFFLSVSKDFLTYMHVVDSVKSVEQKVYVENSV